MIGSAVVSQVRRNVATPAGTVPAISRMRDSGIGPGPLGILETKPTADAPMRTAIAASASDAMQQILTRGDTRNISESSVEYEVRELHTIQIIGPPAIERLSNSTSNARGNMLSTKSKLLLSLTMAT